MEERLKDYGEAWLQRETQQRQLSAINPYFFPDPSAYSSQNQPPLPAHMGGIAGQAAAERVSASVLEADGWREFTEPGLGVGRGLGVEFVAEDWLLCSTSESNFSDDAEGGQPPRSARSTHSAEDGRTRRRWGGAGVGRYRPGGSAGRSRGNRPRDPVQWSRDEVTSWLSETLHNGRPQPACLGIITGSISLK